MKGPNERARRWLEIVANVLGVVVVVVAVVTIFYVVHGITR